MKELSMVEEYSLCVIANKNKTKVLYSDYKYSACIVAGAFSELIMEGTIKNDDKGKVVIEKEQNNYSGYLELIYNEINKQKPKTLKKWIENYSFTFSSKPIKSLTEKITESLIDKECIQLETKKGMLKEHSVLNIDKKKVDNIIEKIRAEFLEEGELTDETIILTALMLRTNMLKKYFSKYENGKLKERIKQIKTNPIGSLVKKVLDQIDAIIIVAAIS
ncbi:GPP34 family phosphoprotein [Vallitalea sediminicola]